jgi:hypothetical protein
MKPCNTAIKERIVSSVQVQTGLSEQMIPTHTHAQFVAVHSLQQNRRSRRTKSIQKQP